MPIDGHFNQKSVYLFCIAGVPCNSAKFGKTHICHMIKLSHRINEKASLLVLRMTRLTKTRVRSSRIFPQALPNRTNHVLVLDDLLPVL